MSFFNTSMYIGAHFWVVPVGAAFTSPQAGQVSQNGVWPDANEPNWASWLLGIVESFELDPKYGPQEDILAPSPGAVQNQDVLIPYALPECKFTLLQVPSLAVQLALNTQQLWATATTTFNPNGGGGPGLRAIVKAQKYDQFNNLILNWQSWAFLQLQGSLKGAPKSLTKPEFLAKLLYSDNNVGSI